MLRIIALIMLLSPLLALLRVPLRVPFLARIYLSLVADRWLQSVP